MEELDQETKDIFEKCIQECVSTKNDCIKKHPKIIVYGKVCHQRRNVGMFSDDSDGYTYSGQKEKRLKEVLEPLSRDFSKIEIVEFIIKNLNDNEKKKIRETLNATSYSAPSLEFHNKVVGQR